VNLPSTDGAVTVSQLTNEISSVLQGVGTVVVVGELSNYKRHTSGHRYFTLKDDQASISGVMWRTRSLDMEPHDGMKVVVGGRLSVYAPRGSYQIDCAFMRPHGIGDLHAAFEELKKKLHALGWFDASRKKALPRWPVRIGVVTSATGAAIQDFLSTVERRFPAMDVVLRPTLVQGDGAEHDIARAIRELDAVSLDVIVITRGGGSIEDLWAFNTETVARAILECATPLISAVGHETDTTIADYVADRRAATPTAAAEIVSPFTRTDILLRLDEMQERLTDAVEQNIAALKDTAATFLDGRALRRISERLTIAQERTNTFTLRMQRSIRANITSKHQHLHYILARLQGLHPHRPLRLGYAVVERNGTTLGVGDAVRTGDLLTLLRHQERSIVQVQSVEPTSPKETDHGKEDDVDRRAD
jgi:exodeoxyribonuclease VII large subunit